MQDIKYDEEVSENKPAYSCILVTDFPLHVLLDCPQLFPAVRVIMKPRYLHIQVDERARTAVAIDEHALNAAGAGATRWPITEPIAHFIEQAA